MKQDRVVQIGLCSLVAMMCMTTVAWGQARPAAGAPKEGLVKISRMQPPGKTSMVRTPEFNASAHGLAQRVNRRPREWAVFEVRYDTSEKWMDELRFEYHVMTKGKHEESGADAFSYYTTSTRYINVPKGSHMSCVVLPPSLVERYGEPVAVAVEVTDKDGAVVASESLPAPELRNSLSKEWWRDGKIMDAVDRAGEPLVHKREGLLDRSKSPFALINLDDYEVVQ